MCLPDGLWREQWLMQRVEALMKFLAVVTVVGCLFFFFFFFAYVGNSNIKRPATWLVRLFLARDEHF